MPSRRAAIAAARGRRQARAGRSQEPIVRQISRRHRADPEQSTSCSWPAATMLDRRAGRRRRPREILAQGICEHRRRDARQGRHVDRARRDGARGPHPHGAERGVRRLRRRRYRGGRHGARHWPAAPTSLDAARLANIAAGIVVGKHGTATVSAGEIIARLERADEAPALRQALHARERAAAGRLAGASSGCASPSPTAASICCTRVTSRC